MIGESDSQVCLLPPHGVPRAVKTGGRNRAREVGLCVCQVLFSILTKRTRVVPEKELSYASAAGYAVMAGLCMVVRGKREQRGP